MTLVEDDYAIVSVEPTGPPENMDGSGWHCYVIEQGDNTIRGYRQGSLEAVRRSVEGIVAQLNERRYGRHGRAPLYISQHGKKPSAGN